MEFTQEPGQSPGPDTVEQDGRKLNIIFNDSNLCKKKKDMSEKSAEVRVPGLHSLTCPLALARMPIVSTTPWARTGCVYSCFCPAQRQYLHARTVLTQLYKDPVSNVKVALGLASRFDAMRTIISRLDSA